MELQHLREENSLLELIEASANAVLAVHAMGGDLEKAVIEMQKVIARVNFERNFIAGGSFLDTRKAASGEGGLKEL